MQDRKFAGCVPTVWIRGWTRCILPHRFNKGPVHTGRVSRFARKFARKSFDVACNAVWMGPKGNAFCWKYWHNLWYKMCLLFRNPKHHCSFWLDKKWLCSFVSNGKENGVTFTTCFLTDWFTLLRQNLSQEERGSSICIHTRSTVPFHHSEQASIYEMAWKQTF